MQVGERYSPRRLALEEMVKVLVTEHTAMRDGLKRAKEAAAKGDFESVRTVIQGLDPLFRQHIADEESQILGLLVRELGVKGAEREIAMFRQHRPIYNLMLRISELAAATSGELEEREAELEALFSEHAMAEESEVFPRAVSLVRRVGRPSSPRPR